MASLVLLVLVLYSLLARPARRKPVELTVVHCEGQVECKRPNHAWLPLQVDDRVCVRDTVHAAAGSRVTLAPVHKGVLIKVGPLTTLQVLETARTADGFFDIHIRLMAGGVLLTVRSSDGIRNSALVSTSTLAVVCDQGMFRASADPSGAETVRVYEGSARVGEPGKLFPCQAGTDVTVNPGDGVIEFGRRDDESDLRPPGY